MTRSRDGDASRSGIYEDRGDGTMTEADPLVREAPPGRVVARVPVPPLEEQGATWLAIEAATPEEAGARAAAWDRGTRPA
jgi:hypothetical protein